jgi:hypothetical protein
VTRLILSPLLCAAIAFVTLWTMPTACAATWQAGLAKAVITPDKSVWLAGYGSKRAPDGKLHELWMKALVAQVGYQSFRERRRPQFGFAEPGDCPQ